MAYQRRKTSTVNIGNLHIGSDYPIVPQSMTTTDTMDTQKSVEQIIRMVNTGCELVRLTAPSMNEAQNLAEIKKALNEKGIKVPLVADIHFTPNAAELAAKIVEKVRVNPGNYADKKKFDTIDYTDEEYQEEIDRIREKFVPLIKICKEHGTALRIGTNHGSLSDRIMSRYGDTAHGMVESAMEFLRIAEDEKFYNIVLSMKSSNPQVMVQAYRLLVKTMDENNMHYPLHLGVTEAGDGDDGRIKSALGIGALLEDGIGDTVRVSLTEDPEFEVPVAKKLIERYKNIQQENYPQIDLNNLTETDWSAFEYKRRESHEVYNFGGHQVPRVIIDFSNNKNLQATDLQAIGHNYDALIDKWHMSDLGSDFIFLGENKAAFMLPMGLKAIYHSSVWNLVGDKINAFPLFTIDEILQGKHQIASSSTLNFVKLNAETVTEKLIAQANEINNVVFILESKAVNPMTILRELFFKMNDWNVKNPIVLAHNYSSETDEEKFMLHCSTDFGGLLIDGFGDGIFMTADEIENKRINQIAFGILQAARTRISKTEYISCPSCGRTLFDLQETTAMIRNRTDHLKGIKIAIMGCIVNGPGEMADADYGYVGSGVGKITLYKGKEVVKRNIGSEHAVNELIELIKDHGDWVEL
ncbi:MAG: (E)-4-hydroxy-3-methylbut-2-enyl-diphosphate synthase [Bacteroidia bacterium]|nr:(E)-4-hydroxy-3-methylbut-2-enyl-diphosphate synthase [Bacteroidia bacterium]